MSSNRKAAIIVGILFIVAAVSSIIGLALYDPILNDPNFIKKGTATDNQILLGVLMELALAVSAVGTSITLYPFLKKRNETIALGYVCFRLFEAVFIAVGILSLLAFLTLRQEFTAIAAPDISSLQSYQTSGKLLVAIHNWTFMLGPNFMLGINTLMCSYLLYQTKLVPRLIAGLGMTGAVLIFSASLLEMFGVFLQLSVWGAVLALPVAAYEMSLAVWLIIKGFNPAVVTAEVEEVKPETPKLVATVS